MAQTHQTLAVPSGKERRSVKQSVETKNDTFLKTNMQALENLGGVAPLTPDIYQEVKRIRQASHLGLPVTWKASIRGRI